MPGTFLGQDVSAGRLELLRVAGPWAAMDTTPCSMTCNTKKPNTKANSGAGMPASERGS